MSVTVATPSDLLELAGTDLGTSAWVEVTQAAIDGFADATNDHQWIHVDAERAKGGPFGGTVAHGYLTLAMIIPLWSELLVVEQTSMAVNYGLDRVRFPAPVPAGSRIRAAGTLAEAEAVKGGVQVAADLAIECDAQEKPVCVARAIFRFYD
jgi:acyl dehydratase